MGMSASPPGLSTPGTHWIGGWVGPRASLDAMAKRKKIPIIDPVRNRAPVVQSVA